MLSRCKRCGTRTLVLGKKEAVLCRGCETFVGEDVAFRKTEIRKAMAGLRYNSTSSAELVDQARRHLEVLLKYTDGGLARIHPEPSTLLRRLDAFSARRAEPPGLSRPSPSPSLQTPGPFPATVHLHGPSLSAGGPERAGQAPFGHHPPVIHLAQTLHGGGARAEVPSSVAGEGSEPAASAAKERRGSARRPADFRLVIHPHSDHAWVRDVSAGGIYVQTGDLRAYRKPFHLVFHSPEGDLETVGFVCRTDRRISGGERAACHGLAIRFMGLLKRLPDLRCHSAELTL